MKTLAAVLLLIFPCMLQAQTSPEPVMPLRIRLTDSVACTPVKDQDQSPTCWAFGTNSLFESDFMKKNSASLDLSEMFIARYAYIDKIAKFLLANGTTYAEGGGQFHDVIRVINKYGMVPEEAYNGRPSGRNYHNHSKLDSALKNMARLFLAEGKNSLDVVDLQHINDTLDYYLGPVPETFRYGTKTYTPRSFAREVMRFANDYIEVSSFADQPLHKRFVLDDKYNWAGDSFYNLTVDEMLMIVDTALAKGWSVGWEGDVTEAGFNYFRGYASLPDSEHNYDQERLLNFRDETTARDHMLHIVGVGKDESGRKWYYMKNSWGTFSRFRGYLYMQDEYFKLKTVILMVSKQALPQVLRNKLLSE